ncbi:MAG: 3-oxoacyl-ACP reductase FabG [Deltaproteobacteria bacterium]|nr:3-oxoacyl-ACP reductase FabG [Deltaproteobacteria bacterium]
MGDSSVKPGQRDSLRVVFVSGASRGIGKGIAKYFLDRGDSVAVGFARERELAEQLAGRYDKALSVQVDVTQRSSIKDALSQVRKKFGTPVQILINNAAMAQERPFLSISDNDFDIMVRTNLRGPFAFCQEVVPSMQKHGWGRIVNIVSIGGQWGGFNQVHYAASKAGLINLTRSIAKIYSGVGITCNAVSPGLVATDMSAGELSTDAGMEKVRNIPVGRLGNIDEVASACFYLCSDEAAYISGQTLNLNGGMYFD